MSDPLEFLRELDPESALAVNAIVHERIRQIQEEGWTVAHDDEHSQGQMAAASAAYALTACRAARANTKDTRRFQAEDFWPWDASWWKPRAPYRDLTRSGALAVAEMARRMRQACAVDEGIPAPTDCMEQP